MRARWGVVLLLAVLGPSAVATADWCSSLTLVDDDRGPAAALNEPIQAWRFVPSVVRNGTNTTRLEVQVERPLRKIFARIWESELDWAGVEQTEAMLDAGQGADLVAGDGWFTSEPLLFQAEDVTPFGSTPFPTRNLQGQRVETLRVSFVEPTGRVTPFRNRPRIGVLDASIPAVRTHRLTHDVTISEHLIHVKSGDRVAARMLRQDATGVQDVTRRIYDALPDHFDFLVLIGTEGVEIGPDDPGIELNRFIGVHGIVRDEGIGLSRRPVDRAAFYGSAGRLKSLIALSWRGLRSYTLAHEILHHWTVRVDPELGISDDGAHYGKMTDVESVMGGYRWRPMDDGSWAIDCEDRFRFRAPRLDRYFMGLIPGDDVPPVRVATRWEGPEPLPPQSARVGRGLDPRHPGPARGPGPRTGRGSTGLPGGLRRGDAATRAHAHGVHVLRSTRHACRSTIAARRGTAGAGRRIVGSDRELLRPDGSDSDRRGGMRASGRGHRIAL